MKNLNNNKIYNVIINDEKILNSRDKLHFESDSYCRNLGGEAFEFDKEDLENIHFQKLIENEEFEIKELDFENN